MSLGSIGNVGVTLRVDDSKLKADMQGVERSMRGALSSLGAMAAGYLTFQTLSTALRATWNAAGEAAIAMSQLEARIKSTGGVAGVTSGEIASLAKAFQQTTIYGDDAVISMDAMLLSFTNIRGAVVGEATRAILDMDAAFNGLNGSAQSLQSTAIQVGKALQDPVEGVTALQRVGVRLTDEQKAQVKAMMDVNDVAGAQRLILAELIKEFGGTAAALRQTPWGEAKALAETFGDTLEELGGTLGEMLNPALKNTNEALKEFNEGYLKGGWFKGFAKDIVDAAMAALHLKNNMAGAMVAMGSGGGKVVAPVVEPNPDFIDLKTQGINLKPSKLSIEIPNVGADLSIPPDVVVPESYQEMLARFNSDFNATWHGLPGTVKESSDEMNEIAKQAARNIQDQFAEFLFDPFHAGIEGLLTDFRRLASQVLAKQILKSIPGLSTLLEANGDAFEGGRVVPFARGGVVNMPTLFPMARGMGLMGEAGPEAVMPLKRGSDGKLGVSSGGGSSVRVINMWQDDHVENYLRSSAGERVILNVISANQGTISRMVGA